MKHKICLDLSMQACKALAPPQALGAEYEIGVQQSTVARDRALASRLASQHVDCRVLLNADFIFPRSRALDPLKRSLKPNQVSRTDSSTDKFTQPKTLDNIQWIST